MEKNKANKLVYDKTLFEATLVKGALYKTKQSIIGIGYKPKIIEKYLPNFIVKKHEDLEVIPEGKIVMLLDVTDFFIASFLYDNKILYVNLNDVFKKNSIILL